MKKFVLLLITLSAILLLASCSAIQVATSSNTTLPGTTTGNDMEFGMPDFAKDAYLWHASAEAGVTVIDSHYRVIIPDGNSSASLAGQILRLGMKSVVGTSLPTTNDKLDNNPERTKEVLLGYISNRAASSTVLEEYQAELSSFTKGVGSFFIGAKQDKVMILAQDDESLSAAVAFFIQNYVAGKVSVVVESDLSSLYFFDKATYQDSNVVKLLSESELKKNDTILYIAIDGAINNDFNEGTLEYFYDIERSQSLPVISVETYSPYAIVNVTQPSQENALLASISVQSADQSTPNKEYSITFNRLAFDNVNAILHSLKNGATGAITIVGDDGYKETTEIMLEVCQKYGAKFNIAMIARNVGELKMDGDNYLFDSDGNYQTNIFSGAAWWQQIVEQNYETIEITSHTLSHSAFDRDEAKMRAEILGAQQVLRDAFPSQKVLTFAYAGYDNAGSEKDMVKASLGSYYIASRGGSSAKYNNLSKHDIWELECCSLYYNDPSTWGQGASNNDGWLMRAINEACTNGGWVVTMNHMIVRTNTGLKEGDMTIDMEMFEHVVRDYIAPKMESGVLWNGFFSEVSQYVSEYNASTMICRTFEDGVILIDLTDTLDDELYDYALTIDIPVDETWGSASLSYTNRNGEAVTVFLSISTAADGSKYVRVQLVPDCGTATLRVGN